MLAVATCPSCNQGQIGFRVCADRTSLVLICEDCGLVWMHPSKVELKDADDPLDPGFARRHPGISLRPSRWATLEEVEGHGWGAYLLKPGEI